MLSKQFCCFFIFWLKGLSFKTQFKIIPEKLQTGVLKIYIRGRNNTRSSKMTERICHFIGHKFSQVQALLSHFVYKKIKII